MGQNARIGSRPRGLITIDWVLACVAMLSIFLAAGVLIRTSVETDPTRGVGGVRILSDSDTLLAFQDFEFEAEGWRPDLTTTEIAGLGPVLGPFTDDAVTRSLSVADDITDLYIAFDLHLLGAWDGALAIAANETALAAVTPSDLAETTADRGEGFTILTRGEAITPQPGEAELPGRDASFVTLSVRIQAQDPDTNIALRLSASDAGEGASWALDNFTVIGFASELNGGR
ncbi:hypothetical protein [Hasllibacter sp. MH4015]|uniref:hypothetical protein n=1 Tax=Hasllibacter sp. MH4015 TaxID=2854029 RepID=UPI001CD5DA23|nr:hypothetical protein [Hasllibacter sp. MH4015]